MRKSPPARCVSYAQHLFKVTSLQISSDLSAISDRTYNWRWKLNDCCVPKGNTLPESHKINILILILQVQIYIRFLNPLSIPLKASSKKKEGNYKLLPLTSCPFFTPSWNRQGPIIKIPQTVTLITPFKLTKLPTKGEAKGILIQILFLSPL